MKGEFESILGSGRRGPVVARCGGASPMLLVSACCLLLSGLAVGQGILRPDAGFAAPKVTENSEGATLAAGTKLYLRLDVGVSTKTSHLRDAVRARVVREIRGKKGVLVPLGAALAGRIDKLIPSSSPTDRARLLLRLTHLELPGQSPWALAGRVVEVENARETVRQDGAIVGVLASEVPLAHLENALGKLAKSSGGVGEEAKKAGEQAFGKADTSVEYPPGTDLVFVLDQPLELGATFPPAVSAELAPRLRAPLEQGQAEAPARTSSKEGKPGDPVNLLFIGSAQQVRQAFDQAGWAEADKPTDKSVWETVRAVIANRGYGAAPVSQLYLFNRPEDLAFEKMLNTFAKRHHLRLWRAPQPTADGREVWLGAATHDTGLDIRPGVVSHSIDPEIDAEREKVGADLVAAGRVATLTFLSRPDPLREGETATGAPWKTDGRVLALELK